MKSFMENLTTAIRRITTRIHNDVNYNNVNYNNINYLDDFDSDPFSNPFSTDSDTFSITVRGMD